MADPIRIEIAADEAAKIEAAIAECITVMQQANEQMARDQIEIEHLKAETREILAQLEAA